MDEGANLIVPGVILTDMIHWYFYFDGRNQAEQLKLFNMSLSEIKKYEKYCSKKPSIQMVY